MSVDLMDTLAPKSDQLNADDLIGGKTLIIKITKVTGGGSAEQPIAIHFEGDNGKPYKPGLAMRRVIAQLWQIPKGNPDKYVGRMLTLYRDPDITFGKDKVGGIRISHASHIDGEQETSMTVSKGKRKSHIVRPIIIKEQTTLPGEEFLTLQNTIKASQTEDDLKEAGSKISAASQRMNDNQRDTLKKNYSDKLKALKGESNA